MSDQYTWYRCVVGCDHALAPGQNVPYGRECLDSLRLQMLGVVPPSEPAREASRMTKVKQGIGDLLIKLTGALMVLAILYWLVGGGSPS